MPMAVKNRDARRLWLWSHGLAHTPTGPVDTIGMIRQLGFVQIDTIRNVTRAHHHILWTRNQNYREANLWPLLRNRALFEHFTHDASLIPVEVLPMWDMRFRRLGAHVARNEWYRSGLAKAQIRQIRERIAAEGPLSTHAFDSKIDGPREMWARPPHKKALDQMWYAGELATSHRENFTKFYDLGTRVFPPHLRNAALSETDQISALCSQAMGRLCMATAGEVQRFWQAATLPEVRTWVAQQRDLVTIDVEGADGTTTQALAPADIEMRLAQAPAPTSRLRIINPFDPAIRDRARLSRLFGFDYRNEMFVPKAKRIWGYYVYPLLEGDRFVGRIEIKADRAAGWMRVTGFWGEPRVKWGPARLEKLNGELGRFARLAGIGHVEWGCPRPC